MKLVIGSRNYSSWSLRVWLVLSHFLIPFEDVLAPLSGPGWKENLLRVSPNGRVPVLIDGDLVLPESIAIIEYVAERYPDRPIWPKDRVQRAHARAVSAEVHTGFSALDTAAPMNLRASLPGRIEPGAVADDLRRIEAVWCGLLERHGGPFLFGSFCAADAMFAPVAARMRTYDLPASAAAARYVAAVYALPSFHAWFSEAMHEPRALDDDEDDKNGSRRAIET